MLVVGVGNRDRGDDAVGPEVCDRLAALELPFLETVVMEAGGVDLSSTWQRDDDVTIVDAARPSGRPGRITQVDALRDRWSPPSAVSTHTVDVAASIELARAIGELPARLTLIGIEGRRFDFGTPLSPPVRAAADRVVEGFRSRRLPDLGDLEVVLVDVERARGRPDRP